MSLVHNYQQLSGPNSSLSQQPAHLKALIRQKEATVAQLAKAVEGRRSEMRQLSQQLTALVDRQDRRPQKEGPSQQQLQFVSPRLRALRQDLEKAHRRNQEVKAEIRGLWEEQPEEVAKQVEKHHSRMHQLERQQAQIAREKQLLEEELRRNRDRIEALRFSSCLNDLQLREKEFEEILRECKAQQKAIRDASAMFLRVVSYCNQMKRVIEKGVTKQKFQPMPDPLRIEQLVEEINELTEERRELDRHTDCQRKQLTQTIAELEIHIKDRQVMIRDLQNDILRQGLESRRAVLSSEPKKTASQPKKVPQKQVNPQAKVQKKTSIVNKVYMMQRQEEKVIMAGEWNPQGVILGDRGESWQISVERARKVTFLTNNGLLSGIRVTYADRQRAPLQGRTLLAADTIAYSETEVGLEHLSAIEYSKGGSLYMRFLGPGGESREIGDRQTAQTVERVSLEQYYVKWVEAQIGSSVVALRLTLDDRTSEEKGPEETPQKRATQGSFGETGRVRKVLLKGGSLGRLSERPLVDHRLLLAKTRRS